MYRSRIVGCGHYLPVNILSNNDLAKKLDTSDEWIESRTGIKQRHVANEEETTSFMATKAAEEVLMLTGYDSQSIDMIVVATTTPDHPLPSTAVKVQSNLRANNAFAFDIQAACCGFIYALSVADNFIKSGFVKRAIVIGADSLSRIINWEDRNTAVLFGDGAGAYLLEQSSEEAEKGILSTHLFSNGDLYDLIFVDTNEPFNNKRGYIKMEGRSVYKHAVKKIGDAICCALNANGLSIADVNWLVPHQANKRILESIADHFSLPLEKMILTIDKHANTSAASIPLATYFGIKNQKIISNDLLVLEALGGGLTWGSAVVRWG